jgi:hypothetical protein
MNRFLLALILSLFAVNGWCAATVCSESGKRCDMNVASADDWWMLNLEILECKVLCAEYDTLQVTVTSDIEFDESAPDSGCVPAFDAVNFAGSFILTGDGVHTISNICMENTAKADSYGMFNVAEHELVVRNLRFKNIRADAKGAKYFGLLAGRVDGNLRLENVLFENVRVNVDSASSFAGGLVGIVSPPEEGPEKGKAVLSNVMVRDFVVNSSSKKAVGGLLGYVQDSLTVMLSSISLSMEQGRIDGEVDANTALFGGVVGMANNMTQFIMDTLNVDISIAGDFDANTEVVNIGGVAGKIASGGFLASDAVVSGNIKASSSTLFDTDHFFATVFYVGGLVGQWKAVDSDSFWVNGGSVNVNIGMDSLLVPFLDVGGILGNAFADDEKARPLVSIMNVGYDGKIDLGFANHVQRTYAGGFVGDIHSEAGYFSAVIEDVKSTPEMRGFTFSGAAGSLVGRMDAQAVGIRNAQASGKIGMQMHNQLYDARSPLYLGGLVGFSENAKMAVRSSSYSGSMQLAVQKSSIDTATAWKAGGLVGFVSKGFLLVDSSSFAGKVMATNVPGRLSLGGLLGETDVADSLVIRRSYAVGTRDTLMEVGFQPADTGSFAIGGLVGNVGKVPSVKIREVFARGALVLRDTLLTTGQEYMNLAGILGRDDSTVKNAEFLMQDAYYRGGFDLKGLGCRRQPMIFGVTATTNKRAYVNAVYAVDFSGLAREASQVKQKLIEVVAKEPSEEFILQYRGEKVLVAMDSAIFKDVLNGAEEREAPAWDWAVDKNDGLPWLISLPVFDAYDGGTDTIEVVPEESDALDTLIQVVRCESIEVYASGNIAKVDIRVHNETPSPVVMKLSLVDGADSVIADTLVVRTPEDSLDTFVFRDIPKGTYRAVVKLDTNTFETTEWSVAGGVSLAADTWTMVALGSVEKDSVKGAAGLTAYRWDEHAKLCDYWQYVPHAVDDDVDALDGFWAYSKSELELPMKAPDTVADSLRWKLEHEFYGWNMVANPYPWVVSAGEASDFEDAEGSENPFWVWNAEKRSYKPAENLPPFGAFWVHSDSDAVRAVSTEPVFGKEPVATYGHVEHVVVVSLEKSLRKAARGSWSVRLTLKGEDGSEDAWNVVGVGSRDVDVAEPPVGMAPGVNLSISGGNDGTRALAKSVRAASAMPAGGSVSWTLAVSSAKPQSALFGVEGLEELDAMGYGAVLVVDGSEHVCVADRPVKLELASTATAAEFRVVPKSALPAVAANSIGKIRFAQSSGGLDVGFEASGALAGARSEVRLLDLQGRTLSRALGKVQSGLNSLSLSVPGHGGVFVLMVKAGSETRSMRIRL